jgi:nicotinamidase/pyrazinamidase
MVEYGPRAALIVVDVQNDFADPAGSLSVRGGGETVAVANREIAAAHAAGAVVAFTQDWHPPKTPHFATGGGIWPVHCVRDTWGAAFAPGLDLSGEVVRKGTGGEDGYSGFTVRDPDTGVTHPTALRALLSEHNVLEVVVIGLAADYCVKATALDALALGYATTVLMEAIRPVELQPGDGERALDEIRSAGGVVV